MKSLRRFILAVLFLGFLGFSGYPQPMLIGIASAQHHDGEVSCQQVKQSDRSAWQGRFSGMAGSMGSSTSMTPYAETNEWRCFRTQKDCSRWLSKMNWDYSARIYLSACIPYPG